MATGVVMAVLLKSVRFSCEFTIMQEMWHMLNGKPKTCETFSFLFSARARASLQYCGLRGFESLWPRGQGYDDYQRRLFQKSVSPVWQEVGEKRLLSLGRTLGVASLDMQ